MDSVWPDTTVEDKNLAVQISTLRQVLEREGGQKDWIETVPGRGYRFVGPVASEAKSPGGQNAPAPDPAVGATRRRLSANSRQRLLLAACLAGLLLVGAAALVWSGRSIALPVAYSPQDRRQSIFLVPFENASADPAQDNIASSLTHEISDIFAGDVLVPSVPPAISTRYRGSAIDLRRIGRDYNVHFVLLGTSRERDGRLIVSATLYETAHGNQVWAQRFERAEGAELGSWNVASLIQQHVDQATMDEEARAAQRDHPNQLDKRDLLFAAYSSERLQASKAAIEAQIALIERALVLDPNYIWALQAKSRRYADLVIQGFSDNPARDIATATQTVDRALQLAPNNYMTLKEKTYVLRAQGNWLEAEALTRRLLELRPRVSARHSTLGSILMAEGRYAEALDALLTAKRLQIATDDVAVLDANIAASLLATGRFREALDEARLAIPQFTPANGRMAELPWLVLIAAESASGLEAEAHSDLNRFMAASRSWRTMAAVQEVPFLAGNEHLLGGLRDAGMPLR